MSAPNPDPETEKPTSLGIYDRPKASAVTEIEIAALVLSLIWLVVSVVFLVLPEQGQNGGFIVTFLAVFMPVAMIWVAATAMRASRVMREESARLQTAIDAIRQAYVAQQQRASSTYEPAVTKKLDEIAAATRKTENALATFSTKRAAPTARSGQAPVPGDQTSLELGTPAEEIAPPLSTPVFLRALNFPETQDDTEGFNALRVALKDRKTAQIVQASQDVLTLLSQEGIYMDDLRPDMARPEVWRQFAQGTRGRAVAALGGVRDRSSLALTAARMKQDPIFRDAAHHFLRRFDKMMAEFEPSASDAELSALGETRTARAFMLLGRVAGTFD
ncbi:MULTISPECIES: hypothetical protein [unclassified Ruegeria]|uniref:hypothetical protein n=1 Tax=unclassified Ruegeria TaxID=2625375 RepID=UPI001490FF72|nr:MULTISPECIES: hypothetical protein [unclassified Ruegeria]NOD47991.1 hypothetical protein [Ruegeria sp. HKCCD5849]NOD52975.1 hypothetical protein [Ruegeria sp. HKCCD5851]NOD69121.1 hypothetical protein [Ruegeria sp. HKCCD7303]